ncbi:MAG: helix-turn-helix transcriptional regulator, partial [Candidatus Krumholzibacteriota bacterium]|nr:helix-turn-helix transcriptional regulator [Candidatus Krumholzibacteriota bacterium]
MTNFFTAGSFKLFRTDYPAEHRMGPHQDCTPKISIVTRGELCETIAGREEFASSGSVVVKPEGVTHADLLGPNGAEVLSLTLPAWPSDPAWRECRWFHGGPATVAATRLVVVLREKHVSPAEIDDIVYDLVASVEPGPQALGATPPVWLKRVREQLAGEFAIPCSVQAIAASAGVHPVHLTRLFRRYYEFSVMGYVRKLRVRAAANALASTEAGLA